MPPPIIYAKIQGNINPYKIQSFVEMESIIVVVVVVQLLRIKDDDERN